MHYLLMLLLAGPLFSQNNPKQFLFVGNSLTYTNNLPKIFENVAANFNETISTKSLCYPNYALEDHWEEGKLQKLINTGTYDYVIVQQGPSSQNEGKLMLIDYGKKIKALCPKTTVNWSSLWSGPLNIMPIRLMVLYKITFCPPKSIRPW
ncbi:MAG: hypothetical protein ACK5M1_14990 [Xanthomarina gelatinilytica]|uniref:hypothetical protein n=1 Tax=Xanthomarina gelatinilytica TaxID=1137281 RepID=UPI003A88B05D